MQVEIRIVLVCQRAIDLRNGKRYITCPQQLLAYFQLAACGNENTRIRNENIP
jgi:hypothetical protein